VLAVSTAASAHVDVAIGLGVPGVVYAPQPVYVAPPPVAYAPAPVAAAYGGYDDWRAREWREHEGAAVNGVNTSGMSGSGATMADGFIDASPTSRISSEYQRGLSFHEESPNQDAGGDCYAITRDSRNR
jgi:hypothetical protein